MYISCPAEVVLFPCQGAFIQKIMENLDWQLIGTGVQKLDFSEIFWRRRKTVFVLNIVKKQFQELSARIKHFGEDIVCFFSFIVLVSRH